MRCQHVSLEVFGTYIKRVPDCHLQAVYLVTQLDTGRTVAVCQRHSYNYARRDDQFKLEAIGATQAKVTGSNQSP